MKEIIKNTFWQLAIVYTAIILAISPAESSK